MQTKKMVGIGLGILAVVSLSAIGYYTFVQKPIFLTATPTPIPELVADTNGVVDDGIITFQANESLFKVKKREVAIKDAFTPTLLENQSLDCGSNKSRQYYSELLGKVGPIDMIIEYTFEFKGESQGSKDWIVSAMPNKMGYRWAEVFKSDFDLCQKGGKYYPEKVGKEYVLFASGCGDGFDDGSGKPHGCNEIYNFVYPTLTVK